MITQGTEGPASGLGGHRAGGGTTGPFSGAVQKLLGHAKLETTTIYTRVGVIRQQQIQSPLDTLTGQPGSCPSPQHISLPRPPAPLEKPVGRMQIQVRRCPDNPQSAQVELKISSDGRAIELTGIMVREPRPGWVTLERSAAGGMARADALADGVSRGSGWSRPASSD